MKTRTITPVTITALLAVFLALGGAAGAQTVLKPLGGKAQRGPNLLANPGFEQAAAGKPADWDNQLQSTPVLDMKVTHGGHASIRFDKPDAQTLFWLSQTVQINQTRATPLVVSGWSKADHVNGEKGSEYSVWVDLTYTDGTSLWGQKATFDTGTHDWQYAELPIMASKPVKSVQVSLVFRGSYTGTVWFDDISLNELHVKGALFDSSPVAPPSKLSKPAPAVASVTSGDGMSLQFGQQGQVVGCRVKGQSLVGQVPGGFWVRDVAAGGPWVQALGQVSKEGKGIKLSEQATSLKLKLNATLTPSPTTLDCDATISDLTGADRAITLYFVLPLPREKWTWHDDIVRSTPVAPGSEYKNTLSWPAAGKASSYPFCSLTDSSVGLSLALPMDCPRVARLVYNSSLNVLYVAWDLGLVKDTINFPSSAEVRFSIYWHDPEWGFRAAVQKYYNRYPQFFVQRLKRGGIWMAFSDISKVKNWQDFGFAYDENSATPLAFDNANDIASFHYIEPMTYWLSMAPKYPRTYDGAMQALADNEASKNAALVRWAQVVHRCGVFTRQQKYHLSIQNQAWCNGAVFTLDPDPNIPEDAACPVNKGHLGYTKAWADKHLLQKQGPRLDGIYLDSMPNWGSVLNWRRAHWRTVTVPLTFDPVTKQPVLMQIFSTWQYAQWVADDVHARGGVMHGNGGALWPYFPALLDVTGQETHSVLPDNIMAMARTLLRNKPYSPLMNTRFGEMGEQVVVDYFNKSLLYDIFPSFFNGDWMKDGKWVHSSYFSTPRFYERDRSMYKQYIPILRRMFAAGWQPITLAHAAPAGMRVERYGPGPSGETLFAVYNPSKVKQTVRLTVESKALKAAAHPSATALVSGSKLQAKVAGGVVSVALPLAAGRCEVVDFAS